MCRQRQRNKDESESGEKGERKNFDFKGFNNKIEFPGSLLDNAQAHPIIVPMSSISQAASEIQPKLLVWPPNSLLSDVNNIALNVFASESYNNLASIGGVKGRKSKTFGGCETAMEKNDDDSAHPVKISTLSL